MAIEIVDLPSYIAWWFSIVRYVNVYIAIENGPVEIVDLPINSMVTFHSSLCKRLPEGKYW